VELLQTGRELLERLSINIGKEKIKSGKDVTCCSFYSSQGRFDPGFKDDNSTLIDQKILKLYPDVTSIQMETFHLFDLANNCKSTMRVAAAAIVLAQRNTNDFLDSEEKHKLERLGGISLLETLSQFKLEDKINSNL